MLRDQMAKTAQLSDFDDELYKVTETRDKPETDKYLVRLAAWRPPCSSVVDIVLTVHSGPDRDVRAAHQRTALGRELKAVCGAQLTRRRKSG